MIFLVFLGKCWPEKITSRDASDVSLVLGAEIWEGDERRNFSF